MATRVRTYEVTEGGLTVTVERDGDDGWRVRGDIVTMLSINGHNAQEGRLWATEGEAQTAASGMLVALNDFLDTADALAA